MNPAPLPQPSAQTCPNCGAAVAGNEKFCPRCGATIAASSKGGGCLIVLVQVVLSFVALILGLVGACFALVGGTSITPGASNGSGESWGMFFGGLFGILLAGLCIWGIVKLSKR